MASVPVTRASLVARLLQRANTSGYVEPTAEAPQLIDNSLAQCYNWMVGLYEDYFTKKAPPYQFVAGQDTFALPADYLKSRQVWYVDTQGFKYPMIKMNISDLTGNVSTSSYQQPVYGYVLTAQDLIVYPRPTSGQAGSIHLWYIPEYTPAVNDSLPVFPALAYGWDEWVILDATINVRLKAMMPVDDLQQAKMQLEQKMLHQAKSRDAGAAPRVRDTGWTRGGGIGSRWGSFSK